MLELAAPGSNQRRAFLRVGGQSVAQQQLAAALQLGCERIVCIAAGLAPELIALQHIAEGKGLQFHVIAGARSLQGLVTANDELVVFADGLFSSVKQTVALLEKGQGVLVQPIDQGLEAGFERIDLANAAAGAMRIPARLVERIHDLAPDCDVASSLQRIALQAGMMQRRIPVPGQDGLFWTLIRSEDDAYAIEPQWVSQRIGADEPAGLSRWLARLSARRLGPALLHAGSGPNALVWGALAMLLLGIGAGWFNLVALGLGLCGAGWILRETALLVDRIAHDEPRRIFGLLPADFYALSLDAGLMVLTGWAIPLKHGEHQHDRYFAAFMLIAMLRILPRFTSPAVGAWLEDRLVLAVILAGAVLAGYGDETAHVGAVMAALAVLAIPGFKSRITRP